MIPQEETEERRARVLVVDDHEMNLRLLEDLLVPLGHRVARAHDGEEALAKVAQEAPDLILLDVAMPRLNGYQVCQRLKGDARTRLIPIIMVTSLDDLEDRIRGIEAGADDFLTKPVNAIELRARIGSLLRLKYFTDELESAETVLFSLALGVEAKDPYTEGHCERLSRSSVALGKALGFTAPYLKALHRGGFLHDVGKLGIPDAILLKETELTEAEWEVMRQHPVIGERICKPLRSLRLVLPIIRHHHEKWNGSGYPDGLKGQEIPLTARILQVADIYDALSTERPYKKALPHEEVSRIMRKEVDRGWWDGNLVERFLELVGRGELRLGHLPS